MRIFSGTFNTIPGTAQTLFLIRIGQIFGRQPALDRYGAVRSFGDSH